MPAVSEKQRRFMGAELGRARAGKSTSTGMSESQLADFARKPKHKKAKGNPMRHIGEMCHMNDHR